MGNAGNKEPITGDKVTAAVTTEKVYDTPPCLLQLSPPTPPKTRLLSCKTDKPLAFSHRKEL